MKKFFLIPEFEIGNNKKYKVETIQKSAIYIKKVNGHLLKLYYLIIWKSYLEKINIWKPALVVIIFKRWSTPSIKTI